MAEMSPVMAMVTVQVKSRSTIRDALLQHFPLPSANCCLCGTGISTNDLWAEHVLDELFNDEEEPANDDAVQPESAL